MCWIAHLVADSHQPCHAGSLYMEGVFTGEDGDRGANSIATKQRKNLHPLWDQLLGDRFSLGPVRRRIVEFQSDNLIHTMALEAASMEQGQDPQQWLEESRQLAIQAVYSPEILSSLKKVSRGLTDKPEVIELPKAHLKNAGRVAQQRAAQSAVRLSKLLRDVL